MNSPRKGDIWYVTSGNSTTTGCEIWSDRPAIVVSNNVTNDHAGFVSIVYLTTQKKKEFPYHIHIQSNDKDAIALCEQIHTVDKTRLTSLMGHLTDEEITLIDKALVFSLGISCGTRADSLYKKWSNAVDRYCIDLDVNTPNAAKSPTLLYNELYANICAYEKDVKLFKQKLLNSMQTEAECL